MYTYTCGLRTWHAVLSSPTRPHKKKTKIPCYRALRCVAAWCIVLQRVAICLSSFLLGWKPDLVTSDFRRFVGLQPSNRYLVEIAAEIMWHIIRWEHICKHMCTLVVVSQTHWTHTARITEAHTAIRNVQLFECREIRERILMSYIATHML